MESKDIMTKFISTVICVGAISLGLMALFEFDAFQRFIPQYAKWIKVGIGAVGGWMLYNLYKK